MNRINIMQNRYKYIFAINIILVILVFIFIIYKIVAKDINLFKWIDILIDAFYMICIITLSILLLVYNKKR